jgi:ribosomal protein S18 acetylase RimI-like enzyme
MINVQTHVRRASARDHRQISNLLFHESNTHRHLDWRPALEWLGDMNFWALEDRGEVSAVLACPEDPPDVAWIRLFSYRPHLSGPETWSALWNFACADIFLSNPRVVAASIVMKQWFQSLLLSSGFEARMNIVMLELKLEGTIFPRADIGNLRIRPMRDSDMDEVARIDVEAFGAFWHNSADTLQRARSQSVCATVAEDGNGLIGYQLSTGNPFGAHLARLGVRVEAQGRGVASALVWDLIQNSGLLGSGRLSVNTQEDNIASLNLYRKFGFVRTGESYPVLVHSPGGVL